MRTIVGLFDDKADSRAVADRLEAEGLPKGQLHLLHGGPLHGSGYDKLIDLGVARDEAEIFAEGLRRGGEIVACTCADDEIGRYLPFFRQGRMADLGRRAVRWRTQGWSHYDRRAQALTGAEVLAERRIAESEIVIPVVEERAVVGKREVDAGRVRVETKIREVPVEQTIGLRKEHVEVERHPVDRPLAAADQAFEERTVEIAARNEEAVVAKEARVVEEVVVRKDVQQTQERVHDTVKKTEVKVERTPEARASRPSAPSHP